MKAFSLILVIFLLSIKQQIAGEQILNNNDDNGESQPQTLNTNDAAKRTWNALQSGWGKRNNLVMDYGQLQKAIPSDDYADLVRTYDYDGSKLHSLNDIDADGEAVDKRAWKPYNSAQGAGKRQTSNWNSLRSAGWGKREPGNWNNLRGLWGKRSSWGRLQGTWGKK